MFDHADIISRYCRAGALRDGVLIDVSARPGCNFPPGVDCRMVRSALGRSPRLPLNHQG
jgi:hypothetical protein